MIEIKRVLFSLSCVFFILSTPATAYAFDELMPLIKACADIPYYDRETTDIHELMLDVLYTYPNFRILSDISPIADTSGALKMCDSNYIRTVMNKAFRLSPPTPTPDMLTELGYYYNNGYYYFTGGYSGYFATNVTEITHSVNLDDGSLYILFSNTYTENSRPPRTEDSAMKFAKDDNGYYVTSIDMGLSYSTLNNELTLHTDNSVPLSSVKKYSPAIIGLITIISAVFVFYKTVLF